MKPKVLYITNLPAPYKISYFEHLAEYVDLTVVFERSTAKNRNKRWTQKYEFKKYKQIYLKGIDFGNEMNLDFSIKKILLEHKNDLVLVNGYSSPTEMIAIRVMQRHHISYGIVCDGILNRPEKTLVKKLKTFLIKNASFWMSSGKETDLALMQHGANLKKIYRYPFSSISERDINNVPYDRMDYKRRIGCCSQYMVLYVGQMIPRKGIDILLESAKTIELDISLYMVGGVLNTEEVRVKNIEFLTKDELKEYYMAADVLVLPSREDIWGLVVNEAMGYGTPVVATDQCGAAMEMIENGKNGMIVPAEDENALTKAICLILNNADAQEAYMRETVNTAKKFTIEKMAVRTAEIIEDIRR